MYTQEQPETQQINFAAIINHGEVADYKYDDSYRNPADPPLSEVGMKQAIDTGDFLKEQFENKDMQFDRYIIECSPYISAMMTAGQIANILGVSDILINYLGSEIIMGKNRIEDLEFLQFGCDFKEMQEQVKEYAPGMYFPEGVNFAEAESKCKESILRTKSEAPSDIVARTIELNQDIQQKLTNVDTIPRVQSRTSFHSQTSSSTSSSATEQSKPECQKIKTKIDFSFVNHTKYKHGFMAMKELAPLQRILGQQYTESLQGRQEIPKEIPTKKVEEKCTECYKRSDTEQSDMEYNQSVCYILVSHSSLVYNQTYLLKEQQKLDEMLPNGKQINFDEEQYEKLEEVLNKSEWKEQEYKCCAVTGFTVAKEKETDKLTDLKVELNRYKNHTL